MPKFKQLTATEFRTKRSNTSGSCRTDDYLLANCSDHNYQTSGDCTTAGETWTASFTKTTCKALVPTVQWLDTTYQWEGDRYVDDEDYVVSIDLMKVLNWAPTKDLITKLDLTTHTNIQLETQKVDVKLDLQEWMEIMAVEVPE